VTSLRWPATTLCSRPRIAIRIGAASGALFTASYLCSACSAQRVIVERAQSASPRAPRSRDASVTFDAPVTHMDAAPSEEPRTEAGRASNDSGARREWIDPPSSFVELIDARRPVYWRIGDGPGASCRRWTPTVDESTHSVTFETVIRVRCTNYRLRIASRPTATAGIDLIGFGAAISGGSGGSGWMRTGTQYTRSIEWQGANEVRIATSEGDWHLTREACERGSTSMATAPVVLNRAPPDRALFLQLIGVTSVEQLRWVSGAHDDRGIDDDLARRIRRIVRNGAELWETTPDRRSCRGWRVGIEGTHIQLELASTSRPPRGGPTVHLRFNEECGTIENEGCVLIENGAVTRVPTRGATWFVDDADGSFLRIGQLMMFSTRTGCLGNPDRRIGPLITEC
jgi:hypothetical protein